MAEHSYKYSTAEFKAFRRPAKHTAMYDNGVQTGTMFWLQLTKRYALQVRWGWYGKPEITHFTLYRKKRRGYITHHLPVHFMYGGTMYKLPRWKKPFFRKLGYSLGHKFYRAMHGRFIAHNMHVVQGPNINASVKLS